MAGDPLQCKIVLIGSTYVGRTETLNWLTYGSLPETSDPVIGQTWISHSIEVDSRRVEALLWDISGNERFRSLMPLYLRGAGGAVMIYDLTDCTTFEDIKSYFLPKFLEYADKRAKIVIVGNKADLVESGGDVERDAVEFAKENGYPHYRVSAKTGEGIETVFEELIGQIVRNGLTTAPKASPKAVAAREIESGSSARRRRKESWEHIYP
jgi:small GTP-binding protein